MKRILPTNDLAFRKVLSSEDTKDILSGLIKDFFGFYVPEDEIKIENPYSIEAYKEFLQSGESISELRETIKDVSASFPKANFVSELQIRKKGIIILMRTRTHCEYLNCTTQNVIRNIKKNCC